MAPHLCNNGSGKPRDVALWLLSVGVAQSRITTEVTQQQNNIQLNNILITTKLLFFLASTELVTQNTEKIEPSCKELDWNKSENHVGQAQIRKLLVHSFIPGRL